MSEYTLIKNSEPFPKAEDLVKIADKNRDQKARYRESITDEIIDQIRELVSKRVPYAFVNLDDLEELEVSHMDSIAKVLVATEGSLDYRSMVDLRRIGGLLYLKHLLTV